MYIIISLQELSRKAVLEQQVKNKIQMESILEDQRKKFQEFLQEQVVTREDILLDGQTASAIYCTFGILLF